MFKTAQAVRGIFESTKEPIPAPLQRQFLAVVMGRMLSLDLQLPTSPVDNILSYYTSTHGGAVGALVSSFNEAYVIDVPQTMAMVAKYYKLRYDLVYKSETILPLLVGGIVLDEDLLPGEMRTYICNYNEDASYALRELLREYRQEPKTPPPMPLAESSLLS